MQCLERRAKRTRGKFGRFHFKRFEAGRVVDFEIGSGFHFGLDLGFLLAAAALVAFEELEGFTPIAGGGLLTAEEAVEGVAVLVVVIVGSADGEFGVGVGRGAIVDDGGFDAEVAALQPLGDDGLVEETGFGGADGLVVGVVFGGELFEVFGVFAGDDEGFGIDAEFEGVAGGDGLAVGRDGSVGEGAVGTACGDLGWGCHMAHV